MNESFRLESSTESPLQRGVVRWGPWVLGALTLLVYLPTLAFPFVELDDNYYVAHNPHLAGGLSAQSVWWAFTSTYFGWWHPITWLSHLLDVSLFGSWAGGHHLSSALAHALSAGLALRVLCRLGLGPLRSAFAAALFAWHPMRVESVVWVSERKDVLCTLFCLVTLLAYARYRERPSARTWAAVLVAFALALASKTMAVTVPVLLLLVDAWQAGGVPKEWRARVTEKLPMFAMSVVAAGGVVVTQRSLGAMTTLTALPLSQRLENVPVTVMRYLGKTLWPENLCAYYPMRTFVTWQWVAALAACVALSGVLVGLRSRQPHLLAGWCAFLLPLAPVIGVVQVGSQAMADRYMYLPHFGLFAAVAAAVPGRWFSGRTRAAAVAICVLVAGALLARTSTLIGTWADSQTLLAHVLEVEPENPFIERVVAGRPIQALLAQGRSAEALQLARELLRTDPNDPSLLTLAGTAAAQAGQYEEAVSLLEQAHALEPANEMVSSFLRFAREDLEAKRKP